MLKFWKNLTGPCGAPTYLPTYLPYLWETKKEITRWVKVGYYPLLALVALPLLVRLSPRHPVSLTSVRECDRVSYSP